MMGAPAKFLFDNDFAAGSPREPTITVSEHEAKLAEAEAAARQRGYAAAQADAKVDFDRRVAATLEAVAARLADAARALRLVEGRLESEAIEIAAAVARKLAPALVEREPFAEIAALAAGCMRELLTSPHIVVRVNEQLYAAAREKLEAVTRSHGFEGRLVVLGEPAVGIGDCRIEWADGGINRDIKAADAAIAEAVSRYIAARRNHIATLHVDQEGYA
jgi:flagellar assembly protein FliH